MTIRLIAILVSTAMIAIPRTAYAYELATHAAITDRAFEASRLAQAGSNALESLGLDQWINRFPDFPFSVDAGYSSSSYLEIGTGDPPVARRLTMDYELNVMRRIRRDGDKYKLNGWLMRGAIREDDGGKFAGAVAWEPVLADNPYGVINRFCNHFYDPIFLHPPAGHGSTACQAFPISDSTAIDATQWVLGSMNPLASAPQEFIDRRNHFTMLDAREAMWRALTLRDRVGNPAPGAPYAGEQLRRLYWATTFRSLGNVLHILQDMAQPQHVRNESHPFLRPFTYIYEAYIEARAKQQLREVYRIDNQDLSVARGNLPELKYGPYQPPTFGRASDYWASTTARLTGLADYTNRGFYTLNNNILSNGYPLPSIIPSSANTSKGDPACFPDESGQHVHFCGPSDYIMGTVPDDVTNVPSPSITMSTKGLFSIFESGGTGFPSDIKYTISKKNLDDRADLLIPRAVGYSAGLLNYFFRGALNISLPAEGLYAVVDHSAQKAADTQGFSKIRLKLQNVTEAIQPPGPPGTQPESQDMVGGTLVAVVKFHRNACYLPDLSGEYGSPEVILAKGSHVFDDPLDNGCRYKIEQIVVSDPIPNVSLNALAAAQQYVFAFSSANIIPINATDIVLQVVYRGKLGAEQDAVMVGTKNIPEPTFWSIHNATNYVMCVNGETHFKEADGVTLPPAVEALLSSHTEWHRSDLDSQAISSLALFETQGGAPFASSQGEIPAGGYVRVAMLVDRDRDYFYAATPFPVGTAGGLNLPANQVDYQRSDNITTTLFRSASMQRFRKTYSHNIKFTYGRVGNDCNSTLAVSLPSNEPTSASYPVPTLKAIVPAAVFLP